MAVFQRIREFLMPVVSEPEVIVPAPPTVYEVRLLTAKFLPEVMRLNQRCFRKGEHYTKYTFSYLLNEPNVLSYRVATPNEEMTAFVFVTVSEEESAGHITTIGVAPEHRRRGLARRLLAHVEDALRKRRIGTIFLEVRASNLTAQNLYHNLGYAAVQRLEKYYNNGEDGLLMVKSLF